jgi:hypothetical protein
MAVLETSYPLPKIKKLPETMPDDGAISIALEEGVPVFRAARVVQERILYLLDTQKSEGLTADEEQELDIYQEIDDYLSYFNRMIRNRILTSRDN